MQKSVDIANLFQQVGGQGDGYQELAREREHQFSADRWPLVSAVQGAASADIPPVAPGSDPAVAPGSDPAVGGAVNSAVPAAQPAPRVWMQPRATPTAAAPLPSAPSAAAAGPVQAPVQAPVFPVAAAADRAPLSPLSARSPLANLVAAHPAPAAPLPEPERELPQDLSSVFGRLAGKPVASQAPAAAPAGWWPGGRRA